MHQFHSDRFENAEQTVEGALGLLAHAGSFRARFTGSQFEVEQPLELRFYQEYHFIAFQDALEATIEDDPERFPVGAIITGGPSGALTSLVIRTKGGHDYTVHIVAFVKP
jgi:hypothetical protein